MPSSAAATIMDGMESSCDVHGCGSFLLRRVAVRWSWGLAAALPLIVGCADWSYEKVQLGQEMRAIERVFPEEKTRRGDFTFSYLESGSRRTDAICVLLTHDRRVAGKVQATLRKRWRGMQPVQQYTLRGELDTALLGLGEVGPVDVLRTVADDITSEGDDAFEREAHGWVAAGLVRLVEAWPQTADPGPAYPRLADMLDRVPAGGRAAINTIGDKRLGISYEQP